MQKILFFLFTIIISQVMTAQSVGIGTNRPHVSAILDLTSTTGGLLVPRMTAVQRRAIGTPTSGLIVYQTNAELLSPFSKGGFYIYSFNVWKTLMDNDDKYWNNSTSRNWVFNTSDSIGIGNSSPTQRLDVDGNIRSRNNIIADKNITATGTVNAAALYTAGGITALGTGVFNGNLSTNSNVNADGTVSGAALYTGGNITALGTGVFNGSLTTNADLIVNNTAATLQLNDGGSKKGYFQLSGNDVRLGTNSGNSGGKIILRMNGDDVINFENSAGLGTRMRLYNSNGASSGVLQTVSTGNRLSLTNPIITGTVELGGEIIINNSTSRVGIGTYTPIEKLHVNGNAKVSGSIIAERGNFSGNVYMNDSLSVANYLRTYTVDCINLKLGFGSYLSPGVNGSISMGDNAKVYGNGICLLTDQASGGANISLHTNHQMAMRFRNGYKFWTSYDLSTGVQLDPGGSSWSTISDSTKKENFSSPDLNYFLQKIGSMKIGSWNYKTQDKKQFRHYGPMAQEFYTNFGNDGIGNIGNDTTIASADMDGVMMIAIQALVKENELLKKQIKIQKAEMINLNEDRKMILERILKLEAVISKK